MAGTLTVTALAASEPAGQRAVGPLSVVGTFGSGETQVLVLAQGDNVVPVPPGPPRSAVLIGGSNATATLKVRTNNDTGTGLSFDATSFLAYPLPQSPAPTSLIVNASTVMSSPPLTVVFL